jgi:hypothetical protein
MSKLDQIMEEIRGFPGVVEDAAESRKVQAAKRAVRMLSHTAKLVQEQNPADQLRNIAMYMVAGRPLTDQQAEAIIELDKVLDKLGPVMVKLNYAYRITVAGKKR